MAENSLNRGWLIAVEGIDGSGKSTQARLLAEALRRSGRVVWLTREPTDGPFGRKIRALSERGDAIDPKRELHYFMQDRKEHVHEQIAPALARGEIVVSDRYYLSSVAYQGARGLDPMAVLAANEALFPEPIALLLTLPAAEGLGRVGLRGQVRNATYEQEGFLARVAGIFDSLQCPYLQRVDARGDPQQVHERMARALPEALRRCLLPPPDCARPPHQA